MSCAEWALGQDTGADGRRPAVEHARVVTEQHAPVPTELVDLAGCEHELGAERRGCARVVALAVGFVQEGAAGRDGGAEGREKCALEKVDDDHRTRSVRPGAATR